MTVQQKQVRKTNQRQANVAYLVFSDDLTLFPTYVERAVVTFFPVSSQSAILKTKKLKIPHIPLLFYSNSNYISEAFTVFTLN